jgi:hypothetical protein
MSDNRSQGTRISDMAINREQPQCIPVKSTSKIAGDKWVKSIRTQSRSDNNPRNNNTSHLSATCLIDPVILLTSNNNQTQHNSNQHSNKKNKTHVS